ncbi:MAG: transposase [Sulfuricella sp.]|nr:transposase [Sulfuricella sp.]
MPRCTKTSISAALRGSLCSTPGNTPRSIKNTASSFYSSQECAVCGHVHQDNRVSQSEFVCLSCGNNDHADHNAAKVIAMRGVRQLLAGKCVQKEKKRCGITRIKVGAEGSEPAAETQSPPGKTVVSRLGGNTPALWSLTQETPATTPTGV